MSSLFQMLVAEYTRSLNDALSNKDSVCEAGSVARATSVEVRPILDLAVSETRNGVSLFPAPDVGSKADWNIFIQDSEDLVQGVMSYKLLERLPGLETTTLFVAKSHQALLSRSIDKNGNGTFARLLDSGQITRRDLLKTLAWSSEARAIGIQAVIIPSPSNWLTESDPLRPEGRKIFLRMTS